MARPVIRFSRIVRLTLDSLPESYREKMNATLNALADKPFESWPKESVNGFRPAEGMEIVRVPPDLLVFVRKDAAGDLNVVQFIYEDTYHELRSSAAKQGASG
jgi:hypothetical protein